MKPHLFFALAIFCAFLTNAQTDDEPFTIKVTPLTVEDRQESAPLIAPLNEPMERSGTNSGASGTDGISETTGDLSVSLTGGATYNVPIKVPPGINGVVPTIGISYNSQGGNGIAGYGWSISGISVISRIPSTKYHDNHIDPVDFDNLDRFALDGQRLILKSGTYGANGAVYQTENFSNVKIVSNGTSAFAGVYGPLSFTVTYPDGSIATYGNSTDSRSRTDYAITRWQNPQGVAVDYTYSTADNSLSISSIKYGHRTTGTAPNSINFIYKPRARAEQSFVGGVDFKRKNLLSQIKVLAGTAGYRNYILSHKVNSLFYDRLIDITEKSGDNTLTFAPLSFTYNDTSPSPGSGQFTTQLSVGNIESRNSEVFPLDYNADGKMDFVVYPKTQSERNKGWIFQNIVTGNNNIGFRFDVANIFETAFAASYLNAVNQLAKNQGVVLLTHTGTNQVRFNVIGPSGTASASSQYEKLWNAPSYSNQNNCSSTPSIGRVPMRYASGDFNGDGLTDVVAISRGGYSFSSCSNNNNTCKCTSGTATASSTVYFVNLDRRLSTGFVNTAGGLSAELKIADQLLTADVNGDGKTDILHVTNGKITVYTLSPSNGLQLLWTTTDTRIKTMYQPMLGDYNGDGKTDFMYPTAANSATFALFRSTGIGFVKTESVYPFQFKLSTTATSPVTTYNLIPTDINADGRTDILEYKTFTNNNGLNGKQTITYYFNSRPSATDLTPAFSYIAVREQPGNLNHFPIPIFLSSKDKGNNNSDFATISNNRVYYFNFAKDNREDMLLRRVSNNGVSQTITYSDLDPARGVLGVDFIKVYHEKSGQVYPYLDIGVARGTKVVVGLDRAVDGITTIKQVFAYEGAVSHADGLGFVGFQGLARSEWNTGDTDRIWNITKHSVPLRGAVTSEYTIPYTVNFTSIPSDYITRTSYTYDSALSTAKVFKLLNTSQVTQNRLQGGAAISKSFLYDSYNNPITITTDFSGQGSSVVNITYANNVGAQYYIGRPTKKTETMTIGGNAFSTEELYTYEGYLLKTKSTKGNGTAFDVETYHYDTTGFGNIIKKVTTPGGGGSREVSFTYDSTGRYLLTSKDVEGLVTTYAYNTTRGMLTKETNPYGLITQYFYDGWDRLTKVTDYLNKNANTTYIKAGFSYSVAVTADNGGSKITVYDQLKRVTKVTEKDVLGQLVSKSFQYDKFDRIYRESEPYIGASATQWNTTEYDFFGRVNRLTSYTGKVTNITYNNLSVAVNDGTKTETTTKNLMGQVTQVTDPGGTINYTYFGNGAMKTSTYAGITISVEQDGWGSRTKLIDPSAGTYSYAYNTFGELIKETTPKGVTDYTFSPLGKLTQKKITGDAGTNMTMTYAYDAATKLPTGITLANADGNNSTTTFTYDSFKRVATTVETNVYAKFSKWFTYDAFGEVATEESEGRLLSNNKFSKIKVRNTYVNGQLKNVNDFTSNEQLWNITGVNARGQLTTATMGTGLKRTNAYDANGYLTQALAQKNVTTTAVELMKLTYSFNAQRGILNSRSNSMFAWNETFTYDSQDRLLTFNDNSGAKSHTYDSKGRIDVNNGLGQYKYSSTNFQQTELALNTAGQTYFNNYTSQNITYNSFKSPVEINENGKDRINFQYNAFQGRATMFYGDTQSDKLLRRYRRHYSEDGSMEITWDKTTGRTTFVTYVGGDAYSSPVIYHSDQTSTTTAQYLYLHRDYLGSILAITDKNGNFKEKRHFDAWGNIVKWTDGNNVAITKGVIGGGITDRGYTGHEHLFGVGLVNMNGRLYDPKLHRFLMPDNYIQDPYSTLSYNRYSYVLNNPLMYTDPSGELYTTEGPNQGPNFSPELQNDISNIIEGWMQQITSAQYGRWFKGALGKPIENWVNKHITDPVKRFIKNPFKSIFGGPPRATPQVVHMLDAPGNMSASVPPNLSIFGPTGAGGISTAGSGLGISGADVADTVLDFVPLAGGLKDIYKGINEGSGWMVALGAGSIVLDVFTLGGSSLIKGGIKTGLKLGARSVASSAASVATGFADDAIRLTTSSKSLVPSRTYSIFDGSGQLYKFGVTDANLARYGQSLRQAGPGAYGKFSSIMPKNKAHIMEKYLRSLHYNSTGQYALPGMKIPYPVNFNTGLPIRP